MDGYEATKVVFSRIQSLDPDNSSKIMGILLLQDHSEKEMIRLAFGPEALLHSTVSKAKKELALAKNPNLVSPPVSPPTPQQNPNPFSSKLLGKFPNPSTNPSNQSSLPFHGDTGMDDFQLEDQLFFLNDDNPSSNFSPRGTTELFYPKRSDFSSDPHSGFSPNSMFFTNGSDDNDLGFGWKPCLYFAKGYCKDGVDCRFVHSGIEDQPPMNGGEDGAHCCELFRSSNSAHQHRMFNGSSFHYSPRSMNLLFQQQENASQRGAAATMMSEDLHKFGRSRIERSDFFPLNPASRQIYLTFLADSTFKEDDVSNYFSIYGPVQDVRIPYQQKRMFGFVTFVYAETVKIILAKGNPHFVCDSRVLVKPYKEKGKALDKKQQQQQLMERAEFSSPYGTPTLDSRDPFDLQFGGRMYYNNTQEMLLRRKYEEEADLKQALNLQSRRLMNLQLLDVKRRQYQSALSNGSPVPSPTYPSPNSFNQSHLLSAYRCNQESAVRENCSSLLRDMSVNTSFDIKQTVTSEPSSGNEQHENGKGSSYSDATNFSERFPSVHGVGVGMPGGTEGPTCPVGS